MSPTVSIESRIGEYVQERRQQLIALVQELVRIPSENMPPTGAEAACQQYAASVLKAAGWECNLYDLLAVPGLLRHPTFWPGRLYEDRPNLIARRLGRGGGRSLILTGHMDTVPAGTLPWTRDPFGGEIENGRLYGRGANDMKAGIATNLFVAQALAAMDIQLDGDLLIESVVDEEFGGSNGTLAGRLMNYNADAAIVSEPSHLRVCTGHLGGRTAHITLRAPGDILAESGYLAGVVDQLRAVLNWVPEFAARRTAKFAAHPVFAGRTAPSSVSVLKVNTGPFATTEPMGVPEVGRVEIFWLTLPGETQAAVEAEFLDALAGLFSQNAALFTPRPEVEFPLRWLPASIVPPDASLISEVQHCAGSVLGRPPKLEPIEGPCDAFVFHQFGVPAILWGPTGGNTHGADEYVDIESLVQSTQALLLFVCRWCGVH
ncbi:MAG TPA: M20/M25/M40 family metallo-hydrolase [Paludibaculum sp.]